MNTLRGALLSCLVLTLCGCAQFYALRSDVGPKVDDLVAQKQYGKAIDVLEHVPSDRADYHTLHAKLTKIRRTANAYVDNVIEKVEQLEADNNWVRAKQLLSTARSRLPADDRLRHTQRQFAERRAAYIKTLKWRALIDKGRWLAADLSLRRKIAETEPGSWSASWNLRSTEDKGADIGSDLSEAGRQALKQGELDLAKQALELADRLDPGPQVTAALAELKRRQTVEQAREHEAAARHRRAQVDSEISSQVTVYQRCYQRSDWVCARRALTKIRGLDSHSPTLAKLTDELDVRLRKRVDKGIERGRRLYSQGKIQAALNTWLPLRKLDPNNSELEAHIARAQKVLKKLKELREKPADVLPK